MIVARNLDSGVGKELSDMKDGSNSYKPSLRWEGIHAGGIRQQFVPANASIAELMKKAAECEKEAAKAEEPRAAELRREAKLCQEWAAALRSGRWTA